MKFNKIEKLPVSDADERMNDLQTAREEYKNYLSVYAIHPEKPPVNNYIDELEKALQDKDKSNAEILEFVIDRYLEMKAYLDNGYVMKDSLLESCTKQTDDYRKIIEKNTGKPIEEVI